MFGPGVADMKGGLVVMLYALKALDAKGLLKDMAVTVLLNSDEEMGRCRPANIWRSRQPCMTMDWSMNPPEPTIW